MMRVIAGSARGIKLEALPGEDVTRPTINRVKEAMFSSLQFQLPGAKVLDLFAGSGQLGIEALSRGAAQCIMVDQSREAVEIITRNCKTARVQNQAKVMMAQAQVYLNRLTDQFDIILLDPPYHQGILNQILPRIAQVTAPGGSVVCESELDCPLPQECGGLVLKKQHHYGKVLVTRYEKGE